jgi:alkylation response protein AidB-like acyl-CoA dehydrogenase
MGDFFQDGPSLGNQFEDDHALRLALGRLLPADVLADIAPDLRRIGQRAVSDIAEFGRDAETHPPRLISFDPWGRRVDHIETSRGWQELDRISAEEGIVATAYERVHGEYSRLHQLAKLYLFAPSSAVYSCPLAMTDGAARAIEVHGDEELRRRAFPRLTSRDPAQFWTSGQWMTERTGGSDVGGTSTLARRVDAGFELTGTKWFTSATTSQMAMTLARIVAADGSVVAGSRGLSLFYLETRRTDGSLNGITIHRLKDKLGTKALPTAELSLAGTSARLVGQPGEGVKRIVTLVNVTRIYNAVCAVAGMRRAIALARDYARKRIAFGQRISQHPLHLESLAQMQVEFEAALTLVLHLGRLMGREEIGQATEQESAVLRILTPVAKLYTAKQATSIASETLEAFGGAGYVEDTGLPVLLRDAQVLSIWEGTTNVLSLDVLRSMAREHTLGPLVEHLDAILGRSQHPHLEREIALVRRSIESITAFASRMLDEPADFAQASARSFAFALARTTMATFLIEQALWASQEGYDSRAAEVARRWCRQDLAPLQAADASHRCSSLALALDEELLEPAALSPALVGR